MVKENNNERIGVFPKQLAKRKTFRLAKYFIVLISFTAIFAGWICNEKPLYVKYNGLNLFPALSLKGYTEYSDDKGSPKRLIYSSVNWRDLQKEKVIWCPVIFSPGKSDWSNAQYKSPFDLQTYSENGAETVADYKKRHWLGTTKTGADVFSGIIHGARTSLTIGIFSMAIAGLLGIFLGAMAGFFGDHKVVVSKSGLYSSILLGLPLSYFYGIYIQRFDMAMPGEPISFSALQLILASACSIYGTYVAGKYSGQLINFKKTSFLQIDQLISRGIEIFNSIPRIVLVITLSALSRPSIYNLILIIGFTSWTEIARLVRAEMLKVRTSEFILSAEASGIKTVRQIFLHALPNVAIPAITAITLGVASAILIESSLSFLGIGVPADVVTWGSLLNEGRQNFSAWWLVVFPGIAIFTTVTSINILGDAFSESIDVTKR